MNSIIDKWIAQVRAKREGILFVISGPSGVGKGTIVQTLLEQNQIADLSLSISATTRSPRPGEEDGRDYHFVSKENFKSMIEAKEFLEYARIHQDEYYGTPHAFVAKKMAQSQDVILEIDVQGAFQVKENWKKPTVLLFILPPSQAALEARLHQRASESVAQVSERLLRASEEIAQISAYDYCVINEELHQAVNDVADIITAERHRLIHVNFEKGGR